MERYRNGKVYRMNVGDEFYIGSSCAPLPKRKGQHKDKMKKFPLRRLYQKVLEVGWENVSIVLVEEYPCENKMELERRERYWIDELQPSLNTYVPTRTKKEHYEANKDTILQKTKEYREANKDFYKQYNKNYHEAHKETLAHKNKEYREANKEKLAKYFKEHYKANKEQKAKLQKEHYEANKSQILERIRTYQEANKERISQARSQQYPCSECGKEISKRNMSRHMKTQHPS